MIYKDTDFDRVKRNVEEMQRQTSYQQQSNQDMDSMLPIEDTRETPRHQTYQDRNGYDAMDESATEGDMSMSV